MQIDPEILHLLSDYRYWILLPLIIIEGPIAITAGGFLASAGDMKLHWVLILGIFGDLFGDYFYYYLGKFGGKKIAVKWGKYMGLTEARLQKLQLTFTKHKIKTIIVAKLSNTLGTPVLFCAGLFNVSLKEFTIYNTGATILKTFVLVFIGFWYGNAYVNIFKYLKWGYNGFLLLIILAFVIFFSLKYVSRKIKQTNKIESK